VYFSFALPTLMCRLCARTDSSPSWVGIPNAFKIFILCLCFSRGVTRRILCNRGATFVFHSGRFLALHSLRRALKKAAHLLRSYNYSTGNAHEDAHTVTLIDKLCALQFCLCVRMLVYLNVRYLNWCFISNVIRCSCVFVEFVRLFVRINSNSVQSCSPEHSFDETSMFRDPLMVRVVLCPCRHAFFLLIRFVQ
jgi:hypothetical protein